MKGQKILIVDDNREVVYSLAKLLEYEGYEILKAYDGIEALSVVSEQQVDLILLDIMMPRMNGISTLMKIRTTKKIPIIILSAKTEESDKVSGLTMGADDYVTKPFHTEELMARIQAQLRRYLIWTEGKPDEKEEQIINGGLVLDLQTKMILVDGKEEKLTPKEYKILKFLMSHLGRVFSAEEIYQNVWEEEQSFAVENTVMVHIRRIREKIEIDTKNPKYLKVVWGIGYKMERYKKESKTYMDV